MIEKLPSATPSPFVYLLNAMELAAQEMNPFNHGYAEKRKAVLEYVEKLEAAALSESAAMPEWFDFEKCKPEHNARVRVRLFSGTETDAIYYDGDFRCECMHMNRWLTGNKVFRWRTQ